MRVAQADVGQDSREKSNFSGILESSKNKIYKNWPIGDRPGKVWLGSSRISNFLALHCPRSEYTTDPTYYTSVYVVFTSTRSQCKRYFSIILMYVLLYRTPAKLLISDETLGIPNYCLCRMEQFQLLPCPTHAEPLYVYVKYDLRFLLARCSPAAECFFSHFRPWGKLACHGYIMKHGWISAELRGGARCIKRRLAGSI